MLVDFKREDNLVNSNVGSDTGFPFTSPVANDSLEFCKQFKIKQLTWSRGFVFPKLKNYDVLINKDPRQSIFA